MTDAAKPDFIRFVHLFIDMRAGSEISEVLSASTGSMSQKDSNWAARRSLISVSLTRTVAR